MRRAWTAALFVAAAACGAKTGLEVDEPQVVDPGLDAARPADAGPRDAAAPRDAFVPDVPPVPIERCALEMPNAELVGSTPLGPVELRYAWVGEQEDCDLAHLHFSAEPRLASVGLSHLPQEPWLRVYSVAWGYPPGAYDVHLTLRVDGEEREAIGVVTIVRHDRPPDDPRRGSGADGFCRCEDPSAEEPPRCTELGALGFVEGQLRIDAPGWSLGGSFRAPHCHLFHTICF